MVVDEFGPRRLACPKLSQREISNLATCRFVEAKQNIFFVSPSGVGKLASPISRKHWGIKPAAKASNRAFSEWSDVFGEPLLASAALDRLAHDAHMITITGDSYSTRSTRGRVAEKAALEPETAAA